MILQANIVRSSEQNWSFRDLNAVYEPLKAPVHIYLFEDKNKKNFHLYEEAQHEIVAEETTVLDIKKAVCVLLNNKKKFLVRPFKADQMRFFVGGSFTSNDSQKIYHNLSGQGMDEGARVYVHREDPALKKLKEK